jgi:signal transduction histidine kinase
MRVERHGKPQRALAWQAALILLPILLLAALGAYYLRQDRILVRHEAERHARAIAEDITSKLWDALRDPASRANSNAFEVDAGGNLLFPPPFETAPTPQPLDLSQLIPHQASLWAEYRPDVGWLKELSQSGAPTNFLANALFRVGVQFAREGNPDALAAFQSIVRRFPEAVGETGLPLWPLAALKYHELVEQWQSNVVSELQWETLCHRAIENPSILTPSLVNRAVSSSKTARDRIWHLRELWHAHEQLRELHRAARPHLTNQSVDPLFWICIEERQSVALWRPPEQRGRWLASRFGEGTTQWIACHPAWHFVDPRLGPSARSVLIRSRLSTSVNIVETVPANDANTLDVPSDSMLELLSVLARVPAYFGFTVEAAGAPLVSATNLPATLSGAVGRPASAAFAPLKPRPLPPEALATASHLHDGREMLRVTVHLIGADALYAAQTRRVIWFGVLIAVSTLAAGLALLSLWRNFHRQLRLAELKDNFVSSVSHELRAPIASVRLMAEGLERGRVAEPEKQREYFRFIVQECQRLTALIQNVLDVSRIDRGRKQYDFELANVSNLVSETVNSMQPVANERHIQLRATLADSTLSAVLDARAIQQALVNLIDNALKHSPAGSEVLVSAATRHNDARAWLDISVEDHGEGIPANEHDRIFERFYRVGSELRRQTPGAGIGLAIVKDIVQAHHGRVRVQSAPGKGSRFTMELPLKGEPA